MATTRKLNKKPSKAGKKPKVEKSKSEKFFTERPVYLKEAYADFIRWSILTPTEKKKEKEPKTQKAFALKWNISEKTIVDWKARGDYEERRGREFKHKLALEEPQIMESLVKRIHKYGQAMDVELWYALVKGWDKKKVLEIKDPVIFGEGDIRVLIQRLPKKDQQEYFNTLAKLLAKAKSIQEDGTTD
jgi:hypothetical protein